MYTIIDIGTMVNNNGTLMNDLGLGIIIGIMIMPFLTLVQAAVKIIVNAIVATNTCTGDCRQGRLPCNCKNKND